MIKLSLVAVISLTSTAAVAQPAATPPAPSTKRGFTAEASAGLGAIGVRADGGSGDSWSGAGLDVGAGAFVNPRLAVSLRVAAVTSEVDDRRITQSFVGPSLQYWPNANVWLGGGVGLGMLRLAGTGSTITEHRLGLDLRAGFTFNPGATHSWNLSLEATPAIFDFGHVTGVGFLLGYQHL